MQACGFEAGGRQCISHLPEISPNAFRCRDRLFKPTTLQSFTTCQTIQFTMWLDQEAIDCPGSTEPLVKDRESSKWLAIGIELPIGESIPTLASVAEESGKLGSGAGGFVPVFIDRVFGPQPAVTGNNSGFRECQSSWGSAAPMGAISATRRESVGTEPVRQAMVSMMAVHRTPLAWLRRREYVLTSQGSAAASKSAASRTRDGGAVSHIEFSGAGT